MTSKAVRAARWAAGFRPKVASRSPGFSCPACLAARFHGHSERLDREDCSFMIVYIASSLTPRHARTTAPQRDVS